jgi:mRNA interferase MazF
MPFEFGDIVLVSFPFTSQAAMKRRPAVVVSNSDYNEARLDVVVMAVTSQLRPTSSFGEVWIDRWQEAGLLKPSAVKPVFATLEQALVLRRLGSLREADVDTLKKVIANILG